MKSSSGDYYRGLDHVRALAALLVFVWHFFHGRHGTVVPFDGMAWWGPLVVFDEGHTGVGLFMTLSGYLFARLLDGRTVDYPQFFWNRAVRLLPLLLLVMVANAAMEAWQQHDLRAAYWFLLRMPQGLLLPTWPNGGWSITVEAHFYLLLPWLMMLKARQPAMLLLVIATAMLFRAGYRAAVGEVQNLAYWTIVGRIDQFVLGILAFQFRAHLIGRHRLAAAIGIAFVLIYMGLNQLGGLWGQRSHPSTRWVWVVLPTLEGATFAALIAWYDGSFAHRRGRVSDAVAKVGEYSYSIYLLHFFVVFKLARWIQAHGIDLSSFPVALATALLAFVAMMPIGYLSMRFVERPFLALRRRYDRSTPVRAPAAPLDLPDMPQGRTLR
jgi:peptidoglycan/LPS O-acetylase OafA/YrhL